MNDATHTIARFIMLAFSPIMILMPLAVAILVPSRAGGDAARVELRGRYLWLIVGTLFALAIWGSFVLASLRVEWVRWIADFCWLLNFPLFAGLAWPVMRLKQSAWDNTTFAASTSTGATRTAMLINRERTSPITRGMWVLAIAACLAGPIVIGARAFWLFPMPAQAGSTTLWQSTDHMLWLLFMTLSSLALAELLLLPRILRSMLTEPEPMDAACSTELAGLYARQRRRRVLGMFWLLGIAGPLLMSGIYAAVVWFPELGAMWGVIGGIGGAMLGIVGAGFGITMSVERMKIAEVRARLGNSGPAPQG